MSSFIRNYQKYNIWGLFAGPAPASGFHYSDYNNIGMANSNLTIFDNNLLSQIDRVNSFSYDFSVQRQDLKQFGVRSLVGRSIVERPSIKVDFSYWMVGLRNENNLGLLVNYINVTGSPVLSQDECIFNAFTGHDTDVRNLFLAVSPDNTDIDNNVGDQFSSQLMSPSNLFVMGFGDCYLTSYGITASVGNIPKVSLSYIGDNVTAYASGSGCNVPAIDSQSGKLISGVYFTIPQAITYGDPAALSPGDIHLRIGSISGTTISETNQALFA